jgi:hypothetical protein
MEISPATPPFLVSKKLYSRLLSREHGFGGKNTEAGRCTAALE